MFTLLESDLPFFPDMSCQIDVTLCGEKKATVILPGPPTHILVELPSLTTYKKILPWFHGLQCLAYSSLSLQNTSEAHFCLWWYYRLRPAGGAPQRTPRRKPEQAKPGGSSHDKMKPNCNCKGKPRLGTVHGPSEKDKERIQNDELTLRLVVK